MKTKQTKIDRSAAKWLPGAMALAATTASSQAAVVQITLTGNKISSTGGNQLVADLTGDNVADIGITNAFVSNQGVNAVVNGSDVWAGSMIQYGLPYYIADAAFVWADGLGMAAGFSPKSTRLLNPITFSDSRINGGVSTEAWLEVRAFNSNATNHTVELSRLIFDDASTTRPGYSITSNPGVQTEWSASAVPEPSSLGLLALGAGGLLARRRRAA
ncbi:MAG: PEP-CTERM sorting domain-containing protein [Verrucomicrobiota bacterium]